MTFARTRTEAMAQLSEFLPKAGKSYAAQRNFDFGPGKHRAVSALSPAIRHRVIAEEEVISAVLRQHRFSDAEKFVQEVLWRTYWKGWLEMRPSVWANFLRERDAAFDQWGSDTTYAQAIGSQTGIDCFDDWTHELIETGYLHNHARMWFASIWIFTLKLPWALGADFFLSHLLDADPASNTLSWRWVAGLQTVGKTYLAGADNIERYTNGRYAPKGLSSTAIALPAEPPAPIRALPSPAAYDPKKPSLLLITSEDLHPESLGFDPKSIKAVVGISTVPSSPYGSDARRYCATAMADVLPRAQNHFGAKAELAESAAAITDIARSAKVQQIVTAYTPVGPTASWLEQDFGLPIIPIRRAWDEVFWPHATKGFFPFKEKIPKVLAELGLA